MNKTMHGLTMSTGVLPTGSAEQATPIVTFEIGYHWYALPLTVVREIVRLPALVTLAGAPPTLCGLLNLRGQYLPVLDGRAIIGEPPRYDLTSQIVIAGRDTPELGLLVDQVHEVCTVAADRIMPIASGNHAAFLSSVVNREDRSVLLCDLAALLTLTLSMAKRKSTTETKRRRATAQN